MIQIVFFVAAYFATGILGLSLQPMGGFATLIWPPVGIALAALLLTDKKIWPGIFVAAFSLNWFWGAPLLTSLLIGAGNTLEALLAFTLLRKLKSFDPSLRNANSMMGFIFFGAVLSTAFGATLGAWSLNVTGMALPDQFWITWRTWWIGDMLGDLIIAPLLLCWGTYLRSFQTQTGILLRDGKFWIFESAVLFFVMLGSAALIFDPRFEIGYGKNSLIYIFFPLVIWTAFRFSTYGATLMNFGIFILAVWGTVQGMGPFMTGDMAMNLLYLQVFMGMIALTGLMLSAAIAEKRELLQELQAAVHGRQNILAMVSHDIKNPLTVIMMNMGLLSRITISTPEAGKIKSVADRMTRALVRMQRLVEDLLDFSRMEAGHFSIKLEADSPFHLVEELVENARVVAAKKSIQISFSKKGADRELEYDRIRIAQVLSNLLDNAIKFTPDGGSVQVRSEFDEDQWKVFVSDVGPGIPEEQLTRVFERFWQCKSSPSSAAGLGLGLFISKKIIEAHGGKIWAESEIGKGSTFCFAIPVQALNLGPGLTASLSDAQSSITPSTKEEKG